MSDSFQLHGLQHARLPCPSPTPRTCSDSCPSSQWCHPTISSSVIPFSSCPQSFPASGSFPMSQLFASGGQSIGTSASASVLPMNIQDWFLLGLTGLISLQSKVLSRFFSNHSSKASIIWCSAVFMVQISHPYMTTGKTTALIRWTFFSKVMSLVFNKRWYICQSQSLSSSQSPFPSLFVHTSVLYVCFSGTYKDIILIILIACIYWASTISCLIWSS